MSKSDASAKERLKKHLQSLSDDLIRSYREALHAGTPEAVADYRETHVREVVGRFFPRTYQAVKGAIYDSHGVRSASIDCVVTAPNHPLLMDSMGRLSTLLCDGVQCAIEVKPDLRDQPPDFGAGRKQSPEIIRALKQVRSVKRLGRELQATFRRSHKSDEMQDFMRRVPTYVLSMEPLDLAALGSYVARYYREERIPLSEQVDWIAVLGVGLLYVCKAPERPFKTHRLQDPEIFVPAMMMFPSGENTLEHFILMATSDEPPEMRIAAPLLGLYLDNTLPRPSAFFETVGDVK